MPKLQAVHRRNQRTPPHPLPPKQGKRKLEEKTSFFDSTTVKVVALGLLLLTALVASSHLFSAPLSLCSDHRADICHYEIPTPSIEPLHDVPIVPFEYYVKGFPHNSHWMAKTDSRHTFACDTSPSLKELESCLDRAAFMQSHLLENPDLYSQVYSEDAFNTKGFRVDVEYSPILFGVNPQIRSNYEQTLQVAEKTVLSPNFSDSNIEATLKELNRVLLNGLNSPNGTPLKGGKYRDRPVFVQFDDKAEDPEALSKLVHSRFGENALPTFISTGQKLLASSNLDATYQSLSPRERKIWNGMYYTAPAHQKIPVLMKKFARSYRKVLKEDHHPIARAAWVHMQLVNIHPFLDGHGREARILMNAELKRGGYAPIVFFDDDAYSDAINGDRKKPGTFAQYLAKAYKESLPLGSFDQFPDLV